MVRSLNATAHNWRKLFGGGYSNSFRPNALRRASSAGPASSASPRPCLTSVLSFFASPTTPPASVTTDLSRSVMASSSAPAEIANEALISLADGDASSGAGSGRMLRTTPRQEHAPAGVGFYELHAR